MENRHHFISLNAPPVVSRGWEIFRHKIYPPEVGEPYEWIPSAPVKLWQAEGQKHGNSVTGMHLQAEMAEQGKSSHNANLLEYWLKEQGLIPKELRGKRLYFFETIYRSPVGEKHVRCLSVVDQKWVGTYSRFDGRFGEHDFVVLFE